MTEPKLEGIDGGFAPSVYAGGESNLDLQISYPIIYPQNSIIFQTDDLNYASGVEGGGGFLNTFFDAIDGSYCDYSAFGESVSPQTFPHPRSLTMSRVTQTSTLSTLILSPRDMRANCNAVFTNLPTSFQSVTENRKMISQPTINNANAAK